MPSSAVHRNGHSRPPSGPQPDWAVNPRYMVDLDGVLRIASAIADQSGAELADVLVQLQDAVREVGGDTRNGNHGLYEFTVPDARQAAGDAGIQFLPFLGRTGVIVEGWAHLLASWWRLGKTELTAQVVVPWLWDGRRVLYFTEEPASTWADRGEELDAICGAGVAWDRLRLVYAVGADPKAMLQRAIDGDETIVIADTLRHVCGIVDENSAADVRRAVGSWIGALVPAGKTFLGLVHHRKAEGTDGERLAGSHALPALFDVVLEMRADPQRENRRRLTGRSRRFDVPSITVERDDEGRISAVGDVVQVGARDLEARCIDALGAAAEPLTTRAVRGAIGAGAPALSSVHRALARLAGRGEIHRTPPIAEDAAGRRVSWGLRVVPTTSSAPRQQPRHGTRSEDPTSSPRQPRGMGVTRSDSEYGGGATSSPLRGA